MLRTATTPPYKIERSEEGIAMLYTNIKECGLEALIVKWLVEKNGYEEGSNADYNKEYAIDGKRLFRFLQDTQPEQVAKLGLFQSEQIKTRFLRRLKEELVRRGVVDILRKGIKDGPAQFNLYYSTPTENNVRAGELFEKNIFSVTRQLRYSSGEGNLALDLCLFLNGLPIITMELKNQLTKQDVDDAVEQYKKDRDPREEIFLFKRCLVHFAVDDARIKFCTRLVGKDSWFLPFDKGWNDGAGNPPNANGIMTDYLWKDILTKEKLVLIFENYAQVLEETDTVTKKKKEKQIFPRYHQLDVVTKLLADVKKNGVGRKYLIQHSAGSGKSNSIAWLAHQLVCLEKEGHPMLDSVIVVTDRRILDKQIRNTIKRFMQISNTVAWAEHSGELRKAIEEGKRIIVTTIEKFPYIVMESNSETKNKRFAIIIDEAHSGQSGKNSAQMNRVLSGISIDFNADEDDEDRVNAVLEALIKGRKLLSNASYFAFTATPKNKTLETFGTPITDEEGKPVLNDEGEVQREPFHVYTMKQAIQEGFILDVLRYYTPIDSYYRLMKTVEDDPLFDSKRAPQKLRNYVESDSYTIEKKAEIIVEHFHKQVIARRKIGGQARAMVVTESIERCIDYYFAINKCLMDMNSPYKAIIAFSGESDYKGAEPPLTSAGLNEFSDTEIPVKFKMDPYRILVVADMFQTGFDEPLLHTMYVDKRLSDIKAVQTLSRLNRCYPDKHDTFVLDFFNKPEDIAKAFSRYYRTTILSGETDPNKLHDLVATMEGFQVYSEVEVKDLVKKYLDGEEHDQLDIILDSCAARYKELETEDQIEFKSAAKAFCRTYGFLASILSYGNVEWEMLSIFLNLLIPKLPSPRENDLSRGILETIDLESYRNEVRQTMRILLPDDVEPIDPVPIGKPGSPPEPDVKPLSEILSDFNNLFGNISWNDEDNVRRQIREIPTMVSQDEAYRNAMINSDIQNARDESDRVLSRVILAIMKDNIELYKQFQENARFKRWLSDTVFNLTYNKEGKPYGSLIGHEKFTYDALSSSERKEEGTVAAEPSALPYGIMGD